MSGAEDELNTDDEEQLDPNTILGETIFTFCENIDNIRRVFPQIMLSQAVGFENGRARLQQFAKLHNLDQSDDESIEVPRRLSGAFRKYSEKLLAEGAAISMLPRAIYLSLISSYEFYYVELLRTVAKKNPSAFLGGERNISLKDLMSYKTIEDAARASISSDIDRLMRKSHKDQLIELKSKIGLEIDFDDPIWPQFVEIVERRHLFTHNNGVVNQQYLSNCRRENVAGLDTMEIGHELELGQKYMDHAFETTMLFGLKVGTAVAWKICSDDDTSVMKSVNDLGYKQILRKKYSLAERILKILVGKRGKIDESIRRMAVVNLANAIKLDGRLDEGISELEKMDWSACSQRYRICVEAVKGNSEAVAEMMSAIGNEGDIDAEDYREWPVFNEVRSSALFKDTFAKVFDEEFDIKDPEIEDARIERRDDGSIALIFPKLLAEVLFPEKKGTKPKDETEETPKQIEDGESKQESKSVH